MLWSAALLAAWAPLGALAETPAAPAPHGKPLSTSLTAPSKAGATPVRPGGPSVLGRIGPYPESSILRKAPSAATKVSLPSSIQTFTASTHRNASTPLGGPARFDPKRGAAIGATLMHGERARPRR
jgi:hypothetical protein